MLPQNPEMLLSVVNTKLRDVYRDLDHLCEDLDEDKQMIVTTLKGIGYQYDPGKNQFL